MPRSKKQDSFLKNNIVAFLHCKECLKELPDGVSPAEWSAHDIGWTEKGLQVWCRRHEANVLHVDFEGHKHPAATARLSKPKWRYRKNKDGFMGSENRILEKEDKPEEGKVYALTGGPGDKCIANGNTWSDSVVGEDN